MGARVHRGPLRSLGVSSIHNDFIPRAFHGSIGPASRFQEPNNSGLFLGPDCVAGTSLDYKAMLRL